MITSPAIERFRTIPDKISAVHKALNDPHVQEALTLIDLANKPTDSANLNAVVGLHHDSVVSRKYHEMLGITKAIATLRALASPMPMKPDKPELIEPDFSSEVDPQYFDQPPLPHSK